MTDDIQKTVRTGFCLVGNVYPMGDLCYQIVFPKPLQYLNHRWHAGYLTKTPFPKRYLHHPNPPKRSREASGLVTPIRVDCADKRSVRITLHRAVQGATNDFQTILPIICFILLPAQPARMAITRPEASRKRSSGEGRKLGGEGRREGGGEGRGGGDEGEERSAAR